MAVMIAGLVMFIGMHLVPLAQPLRMRLVARLGDKPYRGLFSLISSMGLVLIVVGYRMAPDDVQLFAPSALARSLSPGVVTIAFVLFACANMRAHLRRIIRHPMLIGLMLWSGVHLLANGDLAGTVPFGSFFAYSIVALISAINRGAVKLFVPTAKHDVIAIVAGVALSFLTIRFHATIFGTGPVV